jgi:hypothetical protein
MSADNITVCPKCQEPSLCEYRGIGINQLSSRGFALQAEYYCICRDCGFRWSQNFPEIPVTADMDES